MKKHIIIALCLALAACGGGTGTTGPQGQPGTPGKDGAQGIQGAPGKSAYEIWLDAGNTGTEQDFLDSLVGKNEENSVVPSYLKNTYEYLESFKNMNPYTGSTHTETDMPWDKHDGYKQYIHEWQTPSNATQYKYTYVYNEKELKLANYGVYYLTIQRDFDSTPYSHIITAYTHNRDGIGANVYTPEEGTVFTGGTLAYLSNSTNDPNPTLIKGDSKFTYAPNNPSTPTKLELDFEDWKQVIYTYEGSDNSWRVEVDGVLLNGSTAQSKPTLSYDHVKKDNIEETVGTYSLHILGGLGSDTYLNGAFGGTKQ